MGMTLLFAIGLSLLGAQDQQPPSSNRPQPVGDIVITDGSAPPASLEQLAEMSDLVAVVRIGPSYAATVDDLVVSNFSARVVEVLQSSRVVAAGYEATIQLIGGEHAGKRTIDSRVAPFTAQTEYLLFLKYNEARGVYTPLHPDQSIFRVTLGRLQAHGNPKNGLIYERDRNQTLERIRRRLVR